MKITVDISNDLMQKLYMIAELEEQENIIDCIELAVDYYVSCTHTDDYLTQDIEI